MCSGGSAQAQHPCGLPHSEIPGSTLDCNSPRRIVAYHVLHRPSAPRHPPRALCSLISTLLLRFFCSSNSRRSFATATVYALVCYPARAPTRTRTAALPSSQENLTQRNAPTCTQARLTLSHVHCMQLSKCSRSNSRKASLRSAPRILLFVRSISWQRLDYHKPFTLSRTPVWLLFVRLPTSTTQNQEGWWRLAGSNR